MTCYAPTGSAPLSPRPISWYKVHDEFIEPKDTSGHIGNLPGRGHPLV